MKKHILCFGDSNTHGYCAVPSDCADGGERFNEDERWTCLLQKKLGEEYLVIEEGLSGRTTAFPDTVFEAMSGLDVIQPILMTHEPIDLLVIMLGTNDCKERLVLTPECIAVGLERLIVKAQSTAAWRDKPNILVIAPPAIGEGMEQDDCFVFMGRGCVEKSRHLAKAYQPICQLHGCHFLDAEGVAEFNRKDCMHLTRKGHAQMADWLAEKIPGLV